MWVPWDCALGCWWFLPRPQAREAPVLPLAPLPGQRTVARAHMALRTAKGNSAGSILARAEQARGMCGVSPAASGRESEREWPQELTGALDVTDPASFCADGETEAWRWQRLALGRSVSGRASRHVWFAFFSFGCLCFRPEAAEGRSVSTGLGVRTPGF